MSDGQVPPRLKRWIFIWTPMIWVVLELALFPKNRPLSSGFANVMEGVCSPVSGVAALSAVPMTRC
jgi:hypothetical protein